MEKLKSLREKLGLSQHQFASIAGCNRTQLAMSETNRRPTPVSLQTVLSVLEQAELSLTEKRPAKELHHNKLEKAGLDKIIRVSNVKLTGLELAFENLETKILAAEKLLISTALLSNLTDLPELSRLQVTVLYRQTREKLLRYQQQWIKLHLKIVSLKAIILEATVLKNY